MYNIYMKPRKNKIEDPEVPGGAHDPIGDDLDGDEAVVPRVLLNPVQDRSLNTS